MRFFNAFCFHPRQWQSRGIVFIAACLFLYTIYQKLMHLGSPNLTHKEFHDECFKHIYFKVKGQGHESQKQWRRGSLYCCECGLLLLLSLWTMLECDAWRRCRSVARSTPTPVTTTCRRRDSVRRRTYVTTTRRYRSATITRQLRLPVSTATPTSVPAQGRRRRQPSSTRRPAPDRAVTSSCCIPADDAGVVVNSSRWQERYRHKVFWVANNCEYCRRSQPSADVPNIRARLLIAGHHGFAHAHRPLCVQGGPKMCKPIFFVLMVLITVNTMW